MGDALGGSHVGFGRVFQGLTRVEPAQWSGAQGGGGRRFANYNTGLDTADHNQIRP
ncbi:hypothetical protein JYU34_021812 [Plutella xylostella]|uniref:Uncharacterized protein n=1 Tax=Plutella xylostella TaxID=51655 RepID=A0ABQ7PRG6_PLUXY|nr:hypothetical protein JYU34_021812 [Plutella xylostella]